MRLISVVGGRGLSILYKLHRKGLNAVCIPRSIENDIAATAGVLRLQQRAQLHHRNARPGASGGPVGPQDRRGGGPGRAGRMAGAAGRHRRVCRCGADSRDSLRSAGGGGEVEGKGDHPGRPYGLVVVAEGAKFVDDPQAQADKPSVDPSRPRCRRWQRVMPVTTSSSDRVRPPRPWRTGCNC